MKTRVILKVVIICALAVSASSCSAEDAPKEPPKEPARTSAAVTQQAPSSGTESLTPKYDFSDSSHWNLTVSAWEHLAQKDYEGTFAYAEKCLELYEKQAKDMVKSMRTFVGFGHEDDFAVVNDVATSHYIMGEAYMRMGDPANALKEFNVVIKEYPYAQCWDPKGWFWKVAEVSKKNIEKINKANAGK
jgi:tetratricopeptide (TPR) repeat protein